MLRTGRRAALFLAGVAGIAGVGSLQHHDPDKCFYASVSPPLLQLLSAVAGGLRSGAGLASYQLLLPPPYRGLPILNSFASDSISPANFTDQGSDGTSDDSRCCPGCLGRNSIAKAASAVAPSVVNVSSVHGDKLTIFFLIENRQSHTTVVAMCSELLELPFVDIHEWVEQECGGSGTIIDPDGTILTCAHIIVDFHGTKAVMRGKVTVTLQDGREFEGIVLNADEHSDIAVVKIKSNTPLPAARLGSSSRLRPGDWVIALGCPLFLQNTVTAGIVSCVDRKSSDLGLGGIRRDYLQTDCAVNLGNSGGPLVNLDGEIIGVNVLKLKGADGLSFAVPIDSVIRIVDNFKRNGRVVRPWLGLKMLDLNPMVIAHLKEKSTTFPDVRNGVLVPMITPGSPAEQAGFRPGDVVVEFDGKPVKSIKEIIDIMGDNVGVPFKVLVKRAKDVTVTLTVIPEEADASR